MSDLHDRLVELAKAATHDEAIVAGDFLPKGTTWKTGGFGGQYIGRGMSTVAAPILSDGDVEALAAVGLTKTARTLADQLANPVIVVAASPTTLHLLVTESAMHGAKRTQTLTPVVALSRDDLEIHIGQRLSVRTLTVHERPSGRTFALEGKRLGSHATNEILHELRQSR